MSETLVILKYCVQLTSNRDDQFSIILQNVIFNIDILLMSFPQKVTPVGHHLWF